MRTKSGSSTAALPQRYRFSAVKKLIYRDNTCYLPDQMPMEGIGMYEGYTHMANLFLSRTEYADTLLNESGKFLTAIRKSTAAQRRSPAAILLFEFSDTVRRSCSRRRKKSKLCMKNFYKNRLENF